MITIEGYKKSRKIFVFQQLHGETQNFEINRSEDLKKYVLFSPGQTSLITVDL